jgi:hypothetical protein
LRAGPPKQRGAGWISGEPVPNLLWEALFGVDLSLPLHGSKTFVIAPFWITVKQSKIPKIGTKSKNQHYRLIQIK